MKHGLHKKVAEIGGKWPKTAMNSARFKFFLEVVGSSVTEQSFFARPHRQSAYDASISMPRISRFVLRSEQPAFVLSGWAGYCRLTQNCLVAARASAHGWMISFNHKGTRSCSKKPGSSQQSLLSPSQAAWSPTWSALRLAQPQARLPLTPSVLTRLLALPQVWPQACCATTLASAAPQTNTSPAHTGQHTHHERRWGLRPGGVLRSKDLSYV